MFSVQISIAIALVALLISIFTVITQNVSLKLRVRLRHTASLHNFIKEWVEGHKKYYNDRIMYLLTNITPNTWTLPNETLCKYNDKPLYKDLAKNHLRFYKKQLKEAGGSKGNDNLIRTWETYVLTVSRFEMLCHKFYNKVYEEVTKKAKSKLQHNIKVDYNFRGEDIITPDFIGLIYKYNLMNGSGANISVDVHTNPEESNITTNGKIQKFYLIFAKIAKDNIVIAEVYNKEDAKVLGTIFESMFCDFSRINKKTRKDLSDLWDDIWKYYSLIDSNYYIIIDMLSALNEFNIFKGSCDFTEL